MNEQPPWSAYRMIMPGSFIGLENQSWVHPVGVGERWRQLMMNYILNGVGHDANEACGTYQMCVRMEEGIEVGIHAICPLWQQHFQE